MKVTDFLTTILLAVLVILSSCDSLAQVQKNPTNVSTFYPLSDPTNEGGWILNREISDEFSDPELDTSKWFIEGQDGDYYIWKGRPPSQFAAHNVFTEEGKLKIRTQWEPAFAFANENYADGANNDRYGEWEGEAFPVTTGGVISKKRFLYGYMEARTKTGNAAITGAFWSIGYEQELDIFEQMGSPKGEKLDIEANGTKITIHDWSPPAKRPTWVWKYKDNNLPFNTSDEFHVFAAEWGPDYLKYFMDGKLIAEVTQEELGVEWVLNNPMEIWFDSEIFKWLGLPTKDELPVDFEIDYIRVWQKPTKNLLAPQFFGFEGPILYENNERPLDLLPESSVPDEYQKFWIIDSTSGKYLKINKRDYHSGVNSLEFIGLQKGEELEAEKLIVKSPAGAVQLDEGRYKLSLWVYLDQGHLTKSIELRFLEDESVFEFDLTKLPRRKWVKIEKDFEKKSAVSKNEGLMIKISGDNVPKDRACRFFIDDIEIREVKE